MRVSKIALPMPMNLNKMPRHSLLYATSPGRLGQDRLRTARLVRDLAGRDAGIAAVAGYLTIQQAFSALDRLEVRGRDSAGIHVFVWGHGLSANDSVGDVCAECAGTRRALSKSIGALD